MADPICRWRNSSIKQIMEFNTLFPLCNTNKEVARELVEKRWNILECADFFKTPYQPAAQMGIYYEDYQNMYPKFSKYISLEEAQQYMRIWGKKYYAPNPYTKSLQQTEKPIIINNFLVNWCLENEEAKFSEALRAMFVESIGNTDILVNMLNNFSEVSIANDIMTLKENAPKTPYDTVFLEIDKNDKKYFFDFVTSDLNADFINVVKDLEKNLPLQTIFYGAPGTGKSYKVKSEKLAGVPEENIFRTTFHPDYDYASFVGCYKPTKEDDKITYSFIPQVFTKAYIKAWEETKQENPQPVYLVIEEINRGNCAQIFGDIFQLLDRGDAGFSTYPIVPDADITRELKKVFDSLDLSSVENVINGIFSENYPNGIVEKIKCGELLVLPPNLNLLATMNTSDQSLFPMDSAFKRRWDWEFVPIRYSKDEAKDEKDNFHTFEIEIGDEKYKWTDFLEKVNAKILSVTDSEDKQMGEYFIKKSVDHKTFINKVMYYLWSEVGKDMYGSTNPFFVQKTENENGQDAENQFSFNDLFKGNATELLQGFMKKLEVKSEEEKAAEKAAPTAE